MIGGSAVLSCSVTDRQTIHSFIVDSLSVRAGVFGFFVVAIASSPTWPALAGLMGFYARMCTSPSSSAGRMRIASKDCQLLSTNWLSAQFRIEFVRSDAQDPSLVAQDLDLKRLAKDLKRLPDVPKKLRECIKKPQKCLKNSASCRLGWAYHNRLWVVGNDALPVEGLLIFIYIAAIRSI